MSKKDGGSSDDWENKTNYTIKTEKYDGALNHIIRLMNITEKEKSKRIEILKGLEKKAIRKLLRGQIEEVIEELKDIIDEYKRLNLNDKAEILEITLNEFIAETHPSPVIVEELHLTEEQKIIQILEARSKKAIRRFIQGKTDEAVEELLEIINEFRQLQMEERAKAIEEWMYEFLEKSLEAQERDLPLSERLEIDPELEEQLLSYRTQKIIKRFIQGKHRKAVEEFTQIVNEYKHNGKLDIVEMLEVWFNLFITKMFLVKPEILPQTSAQLRVQKPQSQPQQAQMQIPNFSAMPQSQETFDLNPEEKFKEKISKIKALLKKFEKSLETSL